MSLLVALLLPFVGFAQTVSTANLYDLKSEQTKKLYTLEVQLSESDGGIHSEAVYKDLTGKTVVREQGVIQGAQVKSYEIERPQTSEKGKFTVAGDKIHFEYTGANGKKKTADEKLKGLLLSTANFNAVVKENWDVLSSGKELDVRFAVWDRLETVGFTLKKMGDTDKGGEKWMELRMKPTSFVIAALVDPVYLWYSHESKKLMVMKGRVAPKIESRGQWKDLDAEVVYTYDQKAVSK
ncbi:hypothetical protein AZI85_09395 [Bdellovibrio bacteriovorus]|uniref:DUF3108 domain-containing protein n=1 Tax=Bdellovibrio bacteriovorus TaxID=959 RepID=A0A150WDU1_BDEBC|nr:hypothetical protein [Bdellovibrio bacteriovorus]KYG61156.1 hypothetical protein AZI85_09395 [Bdellovibrio bacteriovorus]